jgi:ABC-type antimicrobial peptide transport system permease subunit
LLAESPRTILDFARDHAGGWLSVAGIAVGLMGTLLLTRSLEHMLYRVPPADPLTFAQIALLMLLVAQVAALLPALKAASMQPLSVLRHD